MVIFHHDSTIDDVARFVQDYLVSDVVGIVSSRHLAAADREPRGTRNAICLQLADLASQAVDYPKTGRAVRRERFPRSDKSKPHFMSNGHSSSEELYTNQRALGQLYDAIAITQSPDFVTAGRRHGAASLIEGIEDARIPGGISAVMRAPLTIRIQGAVTKYRPQLSLSSPNLEDIVTMSPVFTFFAQWLFDCSQRYTISSRPGAHLSEEEVYIGTIIGSTSQTRTRQQKLLGMKDELTRLVTDIRSDLIGIEGDDGVTTRGRLPGAVDAWLKRSWTAWIVGNAYAGEGRFGARSFAWLALGCLLDGIEAVRSSSV